MELEQSFWLKRASCIQQHMQCIDAVGFILVLSYAVWKVKAMVTPLHTNAKTDKTWGGQMEWVVRFAYVWKEQLRTEWEVRSGLLPVSNPGHFSFFSVLFTHFSPGT